MLHWIDNKYFTSMHEFGIKDNWVLTDPDTKSTLMKFRYLEKLHHILIKGEACVDDRSDENIAYFEKRMTTLQSLKPIDMFTKRDKELFDSQHGLCPTCTDLLNNGEKLHRHHIMEVSKGGSNNFGNLVIVHEQCHFSMHYSGKYDEYQKFLIDFKKTHPRLKTPKKLDYNSQAKVRQER